MALKIYFAGSISGGRENAAIYPEIIAHLKRYGTVLSEHFANQELSSYGEKDITDEQIFTRDVNWIREADVIVADVTTPSLGVGYELGTAEALRKPVLCLFKANTGKRLSAMLVGNARFKVGRYENIEEVAFHLNEFFKTLPKQQ